MKKVILFFVVAMAFASCTPKKAEETTKVDSTVVAVDSSKTVVDSAKVDTTKVK